MNNLTIVFSGPKYNDYCMNYTIDLTSKIFPNCEIIVSTNDRNLASAVANNPLVNKLIIKIIVYLNKDEIEFHKIEF